ncbi:MAG TPA: DUF2157 domain-containing protein [Anaerolineae bacterium]|nr:DUF2157 domain-containing protein [Anaerolineae bacterium]
MEQDGRLHVSAETMHTLADKGLIDGQAHAYALRRLGKIPTAAQWRHWLDIALLVLGVGFLLAGIFFFFAYNWQALPKFGKLATVQTLIVLAAGVAFWRGLGDHVGKIALSAAAILLGALLAIYGQVYQTGADNYQLFLWWAILAAGWVAISQFPPLWLGWLGLAQVALATFWQARVDQHYALLAMLLFAINALALWLWEWRQSQRRYGARLTMLAAIGVVFLPTLAFVSDGFRFYGEPYMGIVVILYLLFTAACLWIYRKRLRDIFPLAISGFSLILLTIAMTTQYLDYNDGFLFILIGILVLVESALLVRWLQGVDKQWEVADAA